MDIHIADLKQKLEDEHALLIAQLKEVGRINPDNPKDWEPVAAPLNISQAEIEERASEITSFEDRSAVEFELEKRFEEVERALLSFNDGTYGVCTVCKEKIEVARLDVNPAASTCILHMQ